MWEPRTRREAEEACFALNYNLIHVTPPVRDKMENAWQFLNDNGNSTLQLTIEFWANHSQDNSRSKGQIQYDKFPSTYHPSALCVKIVYEVHNTRFGWVPSDCDDQTAKAGTCCNQGVLYKDHYKALLVLKKNNWYAADHICKQEGGTLFDLSNQIMQFIKVYFDIPPWEEEKYFSYVTEFWSALSVKESQDLEMCTLSRVIRPQPAVLQIESHLDSCEKAKHMAICMKPTGRQFFYGYLKNIFLAENTVFLNTTSIEKTTTECIEECNGFNKVGVTCMGFNFDTRSSTCRHFEDTITREYRYDPSLSIALYLALPITRMYSYIITYGSSK
ncbi:unnamed protein product [Mytilus coruscus]|uniref:Apple domain-containing protein n=1 Tax=Mytilus coruscus TaxID=42192 RepID=A0A6J8DX56_MYTCO|nr:unnamed protein product [Mytilus coruscus]